MKRRLYILLVTALLCASPAAIMMPQYVQAATTGTSGKKQNLLSNTQCIVYEPNYKAESSQSLTPGTTFAKDPYVKSAALYDAYCFMRVEIPTAEYTLSNGKTVISDAVKMLYNGKEGINVSEWKAIKEIPSDTAGTNSVYLFEYIGNNGVLSARVATGKLFDSMQMPGTLSGSKVASVGDFTGAVTVQGFVISTSSASSVEDAYEQLKTRMEAGGDYNSNAATYDNGQQGVIDTLTKEKLDLQDQIDNLEERLDSKLSVGNAKANEVISGKIFSTSYEVGITGTMPNYDRGLFVANSNGTYSWTDLNGKTHTQAKEGYQAAYPAESGIVRNADGTLTVKPGYHAEQTFTDPNNAYTVQYNGNGGSGSMANQTIANNTGTRLSKNSFYRTGYAFTGWNTKADGTGSGYTDQEIIAHNGTAGITLYAQWQPIVYYISFNGNGNTYGSMSPQRMTYDEAQPLNECTYGRDGYELAGWSMSQNGSVQFSDMQTVSNLSSSANATVTLYAIWAATGNAADNHIDNASHNHIWVTKYDSNYHWQECSICGAVKQGSKASHSITKDYWTFGSPDNCNEANHHMYICSCGYSYYNDIGRKSHSYQLWSAQNSHWYQCAVCWSSTYGTETHYWYDANGNKVYLYDDSKQSGTCVVCGRQYNYNHQIIDTWFTYPQMETTRLYCEADDVIIPGFHEYIQNWKQLSDTSASFDMNLTFPSGYISNTGTAYLSHSGAGTLSYSITKVNDRNVIYHITVNGYSESRRVVSFFNIGLRPDWVDGDGKSHNGYLYYVIPWTHFNKPTISSVTSSSSGLQNGWATGIALTISGTESYNSSVNITVKDDAGNVYLNNAAAAVNNGSYSYTFRPTIDAPVSGKKLTITVSNECASASTTYTIKKVDSKAPSMTNNINYSGQWAKSRTFTVQTQDEGSGNVQIGINRLSDMSVGSQNGTTYSKTYTFSGDKYDEEYWLVFLRDEVGNLNQVKINIGRLDNTAPTVTASLSGNTVSVGYSDYNRDLKREGSGVTQIGYSSSKNSTVHWQSASNKKITLPESGTYYIYAKDAAGNLSRPYTIYN